MFPWQSRKLHGRELNLSHRFPNSREVVSCRKGVSYPVEVHCQHHRLRLAPVRWWPATRPQQAMERFSYMDPERILKTLLR